MDEPKPDTPAQNEVNMEPPEEIKAQLSPNDHPQSVTLPEHAAQAPLPQTEQLILPPKNYRRAIMTGLLILLIIAALIGGYFLFIHPGT